MSSGQAAGRTDSGDGDRIDAGGYVVRSHRSTGTPCATTPNAVSPPTWTSACERTDELRAQRALRIQQWAGDSKPQPPCTCLDGCFEVAGCLRDCPCRCEPLARDQIGSQLAATS
jgi:hypothetical protein